MNLVETLKTSIYNTRTQQRNTTTCIFDLQILKQRPSFSKSQTFKQISVLGLFVWRYYYSVTPESRFIVHEIPKHEFGCTSDEAQRRVAYAPQLHHYPPTPKLMRAQ